MHTRSREGLSFTVSDFRSRRSDAPSGVGSPQRASEAFRPTQSRPRAVLGSWCMTGRDATLRETPRGAHRPVRSAPPPPLQNMGSILQWPPRRGRFRDLHSADRFKRDRMHILTPRDDAAAQSRLGSCKRDVQPPPTRPSGRYKTSRGVPINERRMSSRWRDLRGATDAAWASFVPLWCRFPHRSVVLTGSLPPARPSGPLQGPRAATRARGPRLVGWRDLRGATDAAWPSFVPL